MPPAVSVIIPVHNGAALIERALRSILAQSLATWEAIVIDDASTDKTVEVVQAWGARDPRFRLARLAQNRGCAAARNEGLRLAQGEFLAYLDDDDEFYPDYLERVVALGGKTDVLVFGFDMLYEDGPRGDRPDSWDPTTVGRDLFSFNPAVPLGISHRRSLVRRAGRFNEMVWMQDDFDYWKRLGRIGAKFTYVKAKAGIYHIRRGSFTHAPRLTPPQREAVLANWRAGRPIFAPADNGVDCGTPEDAPKTAARRIAFLSPHCVLDAGRGAARAALNGLQLLAESGFECRAFCGTHFTSAQEVLPEEVLAQRRLRYEIRDVQVGPNRARMIFTTWQPSPALPPGHSSEGRGEHVALVPGASPQASTKPAVFPAPPLGGRRVCCVPITLFNTASTRGRWRDDAEVAAFLAACEMFLTKQRPDVVWTYGVDPIAQEIQRLAMQLDIPILMTVDGEDYTDDSPFLRDIGVRPELCTLGACRGASGVVLCS